MGRSTTVVAILLIYLFATGHAQNTPICPATVDASLGGFIAVEKGVCNIQFHVKDPEHTHVDVNEYAIKPDRVVLVFDGDSCLAEKVDVVQASATGSYQSSGRYLTALYGSLKKDEEANEVKLIYQSDKSNPVVNGVFKQRLCGKELTADSDTLAPQLTAAEKKSTICVWQVKTKSKKPATISITAFDKTGNNELFIFDGSDCSGNNLLWLSSTNASAVEATSQTGQFIILSAPDNLDKPFALTYVSKQSGGSTDIAPNAIAGSLTVILPICGLLLF